MPKFEIEVRPRSPGSQFIAYYQIEAVNWQAALEEVRRRFQASNPDKKVADCEFWNAKE